jgi:hypothetical protein
MKMIDERTKKYLIGPSNIEKNNLMILLWKLMKKY